MLSVQYPHDSSSSELFGSLEACLLVPFPQTPEAFWEREAEIHAKARAVADQLVFGQLVAAHENLDFVERALAKAREQQAWKNKGWKDVRILLSGGTQVMLKTPYLYARSKHFTRRGCYPVLEALGIRDGVTPATRSDIALYTVQAGSYQEAQALLAHKGCPCDLSTLTRVAEATGREHMKLRDAALKEAQRHPLPIKGLLAGKRVRISLDGGRVRTRKALPGPKTAKGRQPFDTPWREPRMLVIDVLDAKGKPDPLSLPLYDALIADADTTFALMIGYLRLLGAAQATEVVFIADGAKWIWDRMETLRREAEIPHLIAVVDFYHACEHLSKAVDIPPTMRPKQRRKLFDELRHTLRHEGVEKVIQRLQDVGKACRRGKKMRQRLQYFEKHAACMAYAQLKQQNLPIGSGQVESAVRRVINLRFKAPGSFWKEERVESLMHLRAAFKAGRWNELMHNVLNQTFSLPAFGSKKFILFPTNKKNASNPHPLRKRTA